MTKNLCNIISIAKPDTTKMAGESLFISKVVDSSSIPESGQVKPKTLLLVFTVTLTDVWN